MNYLIKNGRVIDPENRIDDIMDILIKDGKIEKTAKAISDKADQVIDAKGKIVAPGLIDMHTHLREPGREDKETICSGTRAAARGGFTTVACMPNTDIPIDNPETVRLVKEIARKDAIVNVAVIAAITEKRQGKKLVDMKALRGEGIIAISDDGCSVEDKEILLAALKDSKKEKVLIIEHCEDAKLAGSGVMNKGFVSTKMGVRGISNASEYEIVKRDIELAKKAGARIHIAHVSTKESVDLIRRAKKDGIEITAETCPHYLALTDECCVTYDTNMKMNPPLRTNEDIQALKDGLKDGTIDVIATDHAPHIDSEKDVEFDHAPFGVIGLETALSVSAMELVDTKVLSWSELIARMSRNPSKILGLDKGSLKKGLAADIVIFDPQKEYVYKKSLIESKSKNSPFIDWKLRAKVTHVFVAGKPVMKDEVISAS
jgi:dihydroorotase